MKYAQPAWAWALSAIVCLALIAALAWKKFHHRLWPAPETSTINVPAEGGPLIVTDPLAEPPADDGSCSKKVEKPCPEGE